MTTAAWIERLEVTQGAHVGRPFELLPWQRSFLSEAWRPGAKTAALSVARGNGKSTLLGAVSAAHLAGPAAQPRAEVVLVASSFGQALICFEHAAAFLRQLAPHVRVRSGGNAASIVNPDNGAVLKVLSSDAARAHGRAPSLVLADEPAQWQRSGNDAMRAALETSMGKIPGSRFVAIGTRPSGRAHWFARWLDGEADVVADYSALEDVALDDADAWRRANPSLAHFPDLEAAIRTEAEKALETANPHLEAAFRAYRLNAGTPDLATSAVLSVAEWSACETEDAPARAGPYVLAFDLGQTKAMSAAAAYWPRTGLLEAFAAFPALPGIEKRERDDGVPGMYQDMLARRELLILGSRVVPPPRLAEAALDRWGRPAVVVADRFKANELRDALDAAGFPPAGFTERGTGWKDGSEDVRRFQGRALRGGIRLSPSLLLRSAFAEAVLVHSAAGDPKLAKETEAGRRARARDDAAAAAILAVAEGDRQDAGPPAPAKRRPLRLVAVRR